jgi:hypothetical protein
MIDAGARLMIEISKEDEQQFIRLNAYECISIRDLTLSLLPKTD